MTRFESPNQYDQSSSGTGAKDLIEIAVAGATGLAVGAAMMYLFDPETGQQRRERIAERAHSALESTTETLGSAGEYVSDLGSRFTGSSSWSDVADDYKGRIGSTLDSAKKAVLPYLGAKARRGYMKSARSGYRDASKSARGYLPHLRFGDEAGVSGTTATAGALGALALGCAAMYLFDPRQGRGRRSYLMDKLTHLVKETGQLARATGQHLANKSQGIAHSARSKMSGEQVDDRTLESRVRSQLGHFGNISDLDVQSLGGTVILRGRCADSEIANLVAAAEAVRGVQRVRCELQAYGLNPQSSINPTAM